MLYNVTEDMLIYSVRNGGTFVPYRNIVVIYNVTMTLLEKVLLMCSSVKTIRGYFCSSDFNLDEASHERFYKTRGD